LPAILRTGVDKSNVAFDYGTFRVGKAGKTPPWHPSRR
jgi:hypothetical protein